MHPANLFQFLLTFKFLKFPLFLGVLFLFITSKPIQAQTETRTFNTSGTFQVPHKVTSLDVRVWGAGGGGGFNSQNNRPAAGGGGGGFAMVQNFNVTPNNIIIYTVGGGGVGGSNSITSTAGGNSSFGNITANGGGRGTVTTGGVGGGTTNGSVGFSFNGGASPDSNGSNNHGGTGGGAAGSFIGVGANGDQNTGGTGGNGGTGVNGAGNGGAGGNNDQSGLNGGVPGGGGGGEGGNGAQGGNGGNGRIIVSWTCPAPALISGMQNQTFCIGGTVSPVVFEVGGALNVTVDGLPDGVDFDYDQGDVIISGTPTEAGNFTYTITPFGSCETNSIQGTIRVNPNNTTGTITANTFCRNSPISAGVFQQTTGATDIGTPAGLPNGVQVEFINNQIEFSGTPTESGIFTYSIPLEGGCATINATGTITINEEVSILKENLEGQISCPGTPFNPISVQEGFGLTYQWYSNTTNSNSGGSPIIGATLNTYEPSSATVGTTYYYVEVSGACGDTAVSNESGAFIVDPGNSVTSASDSPIVCINSTLGAITHTTTVATGITNDGIDTGVNGLPPGVSATWSDNQISINGIPTTFGVFNYSIPLTGGCGTVAATGTITVNTEPEIIAPDMPEQSVCLNSSFSPISVGQGTGLAYQWYSNDNNSNIGGTLIPGATSYEYTPTADVVGERYYYVTVTSSCGTSVTSNPSEVHEVYALPTPAFESQPSGDVCVDEDITYTTTAGQENYQWELPGIEGIDYTIVAGGTDLDNSLIVRWLTSGTKALSVNYTDINGCTAPNLTTSNTVNVQRNSFTPTVPALPSICIDAEMAAVTIGTSLATGIGAAVGLPQGVTANWDSNTITLSGTPLESGTFNYEIPLTGGCGTVSATGTLVVTPVYELTSTASVSPSFEGGPAIVTVRGTTTNLPNGTYTVTYSLGLANSGTFTTTVNVVNGRGTFTTVGINDPDLTSLEILNIRRPTDACTVDLTERNITFFGTCAAVFDANGEFFVPAGITEITIKVWGGGGGGGGRQNNNGAGGGGGGYSTINIPVNPGNVLSVVIGPGGAGQTASGTPGQNGFPSYVTRNPTSPDPITSSIVYAHGGDGASGISAGDGGIGTTINGDDGLLGNASTGGNGGNGGGPTGGSGGIGGFGNGQNTNGRNGLAPGGGGGGSRGNSNGGNGGSGLVIISYSCPPIDPEGCFTVIDDGSRSGSTIIEFTCDSDWIAPEGLIDFEVVVVGGGGGGGAGKAAGGGGAGGFATGYVSTIEDFGMPDGVTFNIQVGQGGQGAANDMERGHNGGSTSFTGTVDENPISFSALGGGGGGSFGSNSVANGASGASGGGGGFFRPEDYEGTGGANTAVNGNIGARGTFAETGGPQGGAAVGGGGGGAAGLGQEGKAAGNGQGDGGIGGLGIAYDLFGTIVNFGGGGGGVGYNFNGTVKDNFTNGGRAPNGSFLGGSGNVAGTGGDAPGIGSGGGAGTEGGGQGGRGRVFIVYSNIRILPVEFLYFQAEYNPNKREASLNWATAKEWENSHFEIERSITGLNGFEKVGEVQGMGWTDQITEYQFIDQQLPLGSHNVLYRLKQVDFTGDFQYSEVVSLRLPAVTFKKGMWRAYPNPTNGTALRISLMDRSQYSTEKVTFRIIHPMFVTPATTVESEDKMNEQLAHLAQRVPKGVFVVEIQWGQKVEHLKILKQH